MSYPFDPCRLNEDECALRANNRRQLCFNRCGPSDQDCRDECHQTHSDDRACCDDQLRACRTGTVHPGCEDPPYQNNAYPRANLYSMSGFDPSVCRSNLHECQARAMSRRQTCLFQEWSLGDEECKAGCHQWVDDFRACCDSQNTACQTRRPYIGCQRFENPANLQAPRLAYQRNLRDSNRCPVCNQTL